LDFASLDALRASLDAAPRHKSLTRVPVATDQQALEFLARNEAGRLATTREAVEVLWQCCQLPDYRDISPAQHGELITRIYCDLREKGRLDQDWIAEQVRFCDNVTGDIDTLSNRIRQIRTWTFVANRRNWLEDPTHWREKTREIEDRLSDALHERLTQRFVDRRTSVLMRHLRDRRMATPEINDRGEVSLEGHLIGSIEGFRFTLARSDADGDAKGLRSAAAEAVAPEIRNRADRLAGAPNEEFVLATDGQLRWRGEVVATMVEGDTLLSPRLIVLADEALSGVELDKVRDRLNLWLRHAINTQLESVTALAEPADLEGPARGIAYRLYENLGLIPRALVADEVKSLDQDVRGKMRKLGIKFGAYHIYVPASLKPAPRELAIMLFALKNGGIRQPGVTELPQTVLSGRTSFVIDPAISTRLYEVAGFKVAGRRAVRVDILERLADIIRPLIALDPSRYQGQPPAGAAEGNGFRVTVEMTSLLGCAGEDFASILSSLGYRMKRVPKKPTAPAPAVPAAGADDIADLATLDAITLRPEESAARTIEAAELEDAAKLDGGSADSAAQSDIEGTLGSPHDEAPQIAEATADLGAPAPDTEGLSAEPPVESVASEPEFEEIWSPGGRRGGNEQRPNRGRGRRPEGEAAAAGTGEQREQRGRRNDRGDRGERSERPARPEGQTRPQRPPHRGNGQAEGKPEGKPQFRPKREDKPREDRWKTERPRREPTFDPDSPFAKLAALRNPKAE
ncbi:MAG: helicase, partial [Devosia sp.]